MPPFRSASLWESLRDDPRVELGDVAHEGRTAAVHQRIHDLQGRDLAAQAMAADLGLELLLQGRREIAQQLAFQVLEQVDHLLACRLAGDRLQRERSTSVTGAAPAPALGDGRGPMAAIISVARLMVSTSLR